MMPLLLDTCAMLWAAENASLSKNSVAAIEEADAKGEPLFLSPISAWEIGVLVSRGRLALTTTPQNWFDRLMKAPHLRLLDLSPVILLASSFLPGSPPGDPADRIIIATAREQSLTIVTRDRLILEYGKAGHVLALAC